MTIFSQESVLFKVEFKPNKKYITQLKTYSYSEVDFIADQEILDRIKAKGLELPMITENETNMSTNLITQSKKVNGEFLATIQYGQIISSTTVNGETTIDEKPFSYMKILGKYDKENKFLIDTIIGDKLTQELRNILSSTLESVQLKINFPEKPMIIGETFKSEIPMSIPMEGMNPILIKINTEYLLNKINGNIAIFDLKQTISLDINQEQINITANGSGNGNSEYNIKENYLTKYTSDLPMDMTIKINDKMTAKVKMNTKSEQNVTIE